MWAFVTPAYYLFVAFTKIRLLGLPHHHAAVVLMSKKAQGLRLYLHLPKDGPFFSFLFFLFTILRPFGTKESIRK